MNDTFLRHGELMPAKPEDRDASGLRLDLRSIWAAVYRGRLIIIIALAIALLIGLLTTFLTTPTFRASGKVQIEQQTQRILQSDDSDAISSLQDADRFLTTQIDILKSRSLANRVANRLNLNRGVAFLEQMNIKPAASPTGAFTVAQARREQVLDALLDNLRVDLPVDSRVVTINFDSPDRQLSARVVNAYAAEFIAQNLQRKFGASSYARSFLESQLGQTRQRLETSERNLIAYARSAGLIDATAGSDGSTGSNSAGGRSLVTSSLVQLNRSYADALWARLQAEQRWRQVESTPLMSIPEVLNSAAIQDLVQQRARAQADYEQESKRHRDDFPTMVQAAAKITEYDRQINRLAGSIRNGIREQYLTTRRQESALKSSLSEYKTETLAEQTRGVQYNILRREVDTNRALYDGLLQRYKEISAAAGIASSNVTIVDTAVPPTRPISPKPFLNLALALVVGLAIGLGLIFVREHLDDVVRAPQDVPDKFGIPLIGTTPRLVGSSKSPAEEMLDPKSPMSEAYHAIRTSLEFATDKGAPPVLLVTSSRPSEGKSTSAFATAVNFASIGKRVVLIDADLRKPSQHRIVSLPNDHGFSDLLVGRMAIADVVRPTGINNLSIITSGPLPPSPGDLLAGDTLMSILEDLQKQYDMVVLDGPPVLGLADAPLLSSRAAGTMFVIEANKAHGGQAKIALQRLLSARARVIGAILTKYDARSTGYGSEYGYSYSYGEKTGSVA